MPKLRLLALAALVPLAPFACGEEPPPPPPTILQLTVVDATTGAPISDAQVLLPARSRTGGDGKISVETAPATYTVRVEAAGYISTPEPLERAVLIPVGANVTTTTVVKLEPRPGASGTGRITGKVTRGGAGVPGVLVLADATVSASAVTDADGTYSILGLAPNLYRVEAFLAAHRSSVKMNVSITDAEVTGTDLELTADAGATVGGMLGMGTGSSTIALALAATGDLVPGLSKGASFGGIWSIVGVPPGRFRVRAALERDGRVLDPELVRKMPPIIDVADATMKTVDLPTAPALEGLTVRTGTTVEFSWRAVAGASFYVVEVTNLQGQVLWGGLDARGQPNLRVLAPDTSVTYGAIVPPIEMLAPTRVYRVRVFAGREVPQMATFELIAASEEVDGRFRR